MIQISLRQAITVGKGTKNEMSYESLMLRYPSLNDIEAVQFVRGDITRYRKMISLLCDIPEAHLSGMAGDDFFKIKEKIESFLKHGPKEEILKKAMANLPEEEDEEDGSMMQ